LPIVGRKYGGRKDLSVVGGRGRRELGMILPPFLVEVEVAAAEQEGKGEEEKEEEWERGQGVELI